jgi:O-antigen/teichoic acid export membrane protein
MSYIKFGYGVIALAFSRAALVGLRLFFIYVIANKTDKTMFANLVFCMTVLEIVRYLVDWGADTYSLRLFSSTDRREANSTFKWMISRQRPISSIVGYLVSFSITIVFYPKLGIANALAISMLTTTSLWYTTLINWLHASKQLIIFYKYALMICLLAIFALTISTQYELIYTLLVLLASEFSLIFLAILKSYKTYTTCDFEKKFTLHSIKKFLYQSTPVAIATMIGLTYTRFDQFYLSANQHLHELANYSLALKLADPITFACSAVAIMLYTRVSSMSLTDYDLVEFKHQIKTFIKIGAMLSFAMSILYMAASVLLIKYIYVTFDMLGQISTIISVLLFVRCLNIIFTAIIQGCGLFKEIMYLTMLNLIMTILLVPLGYDKYQLYGMILAILAMETINFSVQFLILKHKIKSMI